MEDRTTLGERLRQLRTSRGMTMRDTCELTGITQGYISQIENDLYIPSARTLALLARAYDTDEVDMLCLAGILDPEKRLPQLSELVEGQRKRRTPGAKRAGTVLPLLRCNGKPLLDSNGDPTRLALPAEFLADRSDCFLLEIGDDAMCPTVIRGDWVMVRPSVDLGDGDVAVVMVAQRYTLRSCSRDGDVLALRPLRGRFASWTLDTMNTGPVRLIGLALRLVNRELCRGPATSQ